MNVFPTFEITFEKQLLIGETSVRRRGCSFHLLPREKEQIEEAKKKGIDRRHGLQSCGEWTAFHMLIGGGGGGLKFLAGLYVPPKRVNVVWLKNVILKS